MIEALLTVTLLLVSETKTYTRPHTALAQEPVVSRVEPEMPISEAVQPEVVDLPDPDQIVACNCVLRVRQYYPQFPRLSELTYNSPNPQEGAVVILQYKTLKHYAYLKEIRQDGLLIDECNYKRCACGERLLNKNDPRIVGFWYPEHPVASPSYVEGRP